MLGNSLTFTNRMPELLAGLTSAEVVQHTRGGARLAEQLNPKTRLGAVTRKALTEEHWDYVVLQEMSHGPITTPERFFSSVRQLCEKIRANGAVPVLYATWAYRRDGAELADKGWTYEEMAKGLSDAYRQAARENHALLADVGSRFSALSRTRDLYEFDGVHPNEEGARVAAETIAAVIKQQEETKK